MKPNARIRTGHLFDAVEPRQGALFAGEHAPAEAPPLYVGVENLPRERKRVKRDMPADFFLLGPNTPGAKRFRVEVLAIDDRWHDAGGDDDGIDALATAERVRQSVDPKYRAERGDQDVVRVRDLKTGEVLS